MGMDNDRLSRRIAAIATARPVAFAKPEGKADGRASRRVAVYRFGRVVLSNGGETTCIIKDVSENGARISLEGAEALPDLVILKFDHSGEQRRARIAWQREREAGLSFIVEARPQALKKK